MKRVYAVRLYPSAAASASLAHALHITRRLYNAALQQQRDAWRLQRVNVGRVQGKDVTALRKDWPWFKAVYRECLDAVLHRLDLAFASFFRRLKGGAKPGFPRYKGVRRWRQLEFPHGGRALKFDANQRKVYVPMAGWIPLRKGRAVPATYGRAWLVRKLGKWYAYFECEVAAEPLPSTGVTRGFDRGVRALLADSDGMLTPNPGFLATFRLQIERLQRIVAKRKQRSARRRKAVRALATVWERLKNARRDHAHKLSRAIINACDVIALEDLQLTNMVRSAAGTIEEPGRNVKAKSSLNRVVLDAGFGQLARLICEKAESASRRVIFVNPAGTSQTCSQCGHVDPASRKGAVFRCTACDVLVDADVNAARNILRRAELSACGEARPDRGRRRPAKYVTVEADPRLTQHDAA